MTLSDFDVWYKTRYRRTSSALTITAFIFSDLFAVLLTFAWGFFCVRVYGFIVNNGGVINTKSFITYWPYLPVFILFFQLHKLYPGLSLAPSEEMRRFFISSMITYGGIMMSRLVEHQVWDSINTAFLISFAFSTIILLTARSLTYWVLFKTKLGGIPAVIYGSGNTGKKVADCLLSSIRSGYKPVLILDDNPLDSEYKNIPIIHDTSIGYEIVNRYKIKVAIVAMPSLDTKRLKHLLSTSISAFRYNIIIPNFFDLSSIWMSVREFNGILGIDISNKLKLKWNLAIKRFMDLAIVIFGLLITLPFFPLIALLVKISSPGPIFHKCRRLGRNGQVFFVYKFRTMVIDAEQRLHDLLESDPALKKQWDETSKLQNDPRITGIGKFLRRTSIDEIPQFINILKGEMSLIGPRPFENDDLTKYGEDDYNRVFSIKPGLSGLWQVSGRSDANFNERVAYDAYYLQSWSVWLDLWIIFKTFGVVILGKGAY